MNATSRFLPSASSPVSVEGPSARMSPCCTWSPSSTRGFWLMQVSWFDRRNFAQPVDLAALRLVLDRDRLAVDLGDDAVVLGEDHVGGVAGGAGLDAGADVGRLGPHQRHGLALHVGAHEGAVGVVVLEERDERGGHRDDLLRRDVHELDLVRRHVADVGGGAEEHVALELQLEVGQRRGLRRAPHEHRLVGERAVGVERRVRLGDDVLLLLVGGEVHDLVGDLAVRRPCGTATR